MNKRAILLGIIIGIIIVCIFFWSFIFHLNKPLSLKYGDELQVDFILKNNMDTILSGKLSDLPNLPMFYGFNNSLFYSNHFILQSISAIPIYLLTDRNIFLTFNLYVLITAFASFFSMYLFLLYLTKKPTSSIIGSIIFTLNPFIINAVPDSLELFTLIWTPLVFLFFERALDNKDSRSCFLFFLFLGFRLLSTFYYFSFLTVILPIYAVVRFIQKKSKLEFWFNKGTFLGLSLLIIIFAIKAYLYFQAGTEISFERDLSSMAKFYSPYIANWFFMPPRNILYGQIGEKVWQEAPAFFSVNGIDNLSFFWGFIPLILFIMSFRIFKNHKNRNYWLICTGLLILSLIFSFGPKIQITSYLNLPGLYTLLYKINPLFLPLRVPARFAMMVFFFLAIVISITLKEIMTKMNKKMSIVLAIILVCAILFEYWVKPFEFTRISDQRKKFYLFLKNQKHIKVIVDLPIGNRLGSYNQYSRTETLDSHYLFWQMLHGKKILNGYSSYLPERYVIRANFLSDGFPTKEKIELLRNWKVDAIILHKDEFIFPEHFSNIKSGLENLGFTSIAKTERVILFDITK